jgi:hypothetical protein
MGWPAEVSPCLTALDSMPDAHRPWTRLQRPADHPDAATCRGMLAPGVEASELEVAYASARLCNHLTREAGYEPAYLAR